MVAWVLAFVACGPGAPVVGGDAVPEDTGPGGDTNAEETATPSVGQLYVNEIMADNVATLEGTEGGWPDWIELYNPGETRVVLDGWTITDDLAEPDRHTLSGVAVAARGFLLLVADDDESLGDDHVAFALEGSGESVGLFDADGNPVDGVTFGPLADDISLARVRDGGAAWSLVTTPTPGATNGGS